MTVKIKRVPRRRVFLIAPDPGSTPRLIRAHTRAKAVRHFTDKMRIEVASQDDLIALLSKGIKVEDAVEPGPKNGSSSETKAAA